MSALGGFVSGVIGLSLLEAVVSSSQATDRASGVFTGAASLLRHLASPEVPAIPDLRIPASQRPQLAPTPPPAASSTVRGSGVGATPTNYARPATRLPVSTAL
jgi:hypothetical protein